MSADPEPSTGRPAGAWRRGRAALMGSAIALLTLSVLTGQPTSGTGRPATPTASGRASGGGAGVQVSAAATATPSGSSTALAEDQRQGTPGWRIGATQGRTPGLEAFAGSVSVLPGDPVRLFVATPTVQHVTVRALRIGPYGGAGARQVWTGTVEAGPQPAAARDQAGLVTAPWAVSAAIDTTGWPEGHYVLRLDAGPAARYVPLTVRSTTAVGRVLVVAAAMTWQAYNQWGDVSLYGGDERQPKVAKARAVSFDRPYGDGYGAGRFFTYDAPVATLAQGLAIPLAWATDVDVAEHPELVRAAAAVVIGGHAEYWTAGMRDAVEAAAAEGTNLAVFGANTAYWRVRLLSGGRVLFGSKSAALDPLAASDPHGATTRFRDQPDARPEEELTGMRYDCFPAKADWTVSDPAWWGYEGAGVTAGERLPALVGPESDRVYDVPSRPGLRGTPTHVVAYTRFACNRGTTAHTAVYAVRPSGAAVFDAGTMYWPCAIQDGECTEVPDPRARAVARVVTVNLLRAFASPRAGLEHPTDDTVGRYWLPATSTTGSS